MKGALYTLLACLVAGVAYGQLERCHTTILTPHHFLDVDKFLGVWYPLKIAPSKSHQISPLNYTCLSVNIARTASPNILSFIENYNDNENGNAVRADSVVVLGEVRPEMPIPAIWSTYYFPPGGDKTENAQAVVLASDEGKWSIHYTCHSRGGELLERISVWSRERTIDPVVLDVLDQITFAIGYPREYFEIIDQSMCA